MCRAEHLERIRRGLEDKKLAGEPVPADYTTAKPWSTCFRMAAADTSFWDEQVRHPAAAWVAAGSRGAPLAPEEKLASAHLPGGSAAIYPQTESPGNPERRRQRAATKERRAEASQELQTFRAQKVARSDTGSTADSSGKASGKGLKGKGKRHSKDRDGKEICYSWNNKQGKCADLEAGKPCPAGRAHVCQRCLSSHHRSTDCPQSD